MEDAPRFVHFKDNGKLRRSEKEVWNDPGASWRPVGRTGPAQDLTNTKFKGGTNTLFEGSTNTKFKGVTNTQFKETPILRASNIPFKGITNTQFKGTGFYSTLLVDSSPSPFEQNISDSR